MVSPIDIILYPLYKQKIFLIISKEATVRECGKLSQSLTWFD